MASKVSVAIVAAVGLVSVVLLLRSTTAQRPDPKLSFLAPAGHVPSVQTPVGAASSQRLREASVEAAGEASSAWASAAALAGVLATALVAGSVRSSSAIRRRYNLKQVESIVPQVLRKSEPAAFTEDGKDEIVITEEQFLQKRKEGLRELMPMTEEEFFDELDDISALSWELLDRPRFKEPIKKIPYPFVRNREIMERAANKMKQIVRNKEVYQDLRLFKPMAPRYPDLCRKHLMRDVPDEQRREFVINAQWINQTEKVAGFTYEDWAKEFLENEWPTFEVGDIVHGKVVGWAGEEDELGAFVEIGDKNWAFLPTRESSLNPIQRPQEVLTVGEEVVVEVTKVREEAKMMGDKNSAQKMVSMFRMQAQAAWDQIDAILRVEPGTSSTMPVTVIEMKGFGAVVQTQMGLRGWVPNADLGERAGDMNLVGTEVTVDLMRASTAPEIRAMRLPQQPRDFGLTFSYKSAATKELAQKLEEGQVITGKVLDISVLSALVDVDGIGVTLRKLDISGTTRTFTVEDVFSIGEEIKAYVSTANQETGEVVLSTRALEQKPGNMLTDKKKCFEEADATAARFLEKSTKEKVKLEQRLAEATGLGFEDMFGDLSQGTGKKGATGSVELDDLDSDDAGFE